MGKSPVDEEPVEKLQFLLSWFIIICMFLNNIYQNIFYFIY